MCKVASPARPMEVQAQPQLHKPTAKQAIQLYDIMLDDSSGRLDLLPPINSRYDKPFELLLQLPGNR